MGLFDRPYELKAEYIPTDEELAQSYKQGNMSQNQYVDLMNQRLENANKQLDRELVGNLAKEGVRSAIGATLEGASFHPILNIPYVGTGLGGALFEWGDSIQNKESALDTLKNMGKGFAIGETVGAIPYVGKGINKASGGRIGEGVSNLYGKLMDTPIGQKVGEYGSKLGDLLMTDVMPNANKKPIYYHGTKADFDEFDTDFIGTAHDDGLYGKGFYFTPNEKLANSYANSGMLEGNPRVISANLEINNPLNMTDFNSAEEIANYLNMPENARDFVRSEVKVGNEFKPFYRPNGFLQDTGKFRGRVQSLGHDGVIVGDNEVVVFNPEQIKQIEKPNLFDYLKNDSVLTKDYVKNKEIIDKQASKLYDNLMNFENMKSGYINLGGNNENILDLTDVLGKNPTNKEIKNYIESLVKDGPIETKSSDYLIDVPDAKRNTKHIQFANDWNKMPRTEKNLHNKLAMQLKDIIKNSKYSHSKNNVNADKPFVDKYHYFTVNVKIGDNVYPIVLDAEQFVGEKTIKPQTVHLYNFKKK